MQLRVYECVYTLYHTIPDVTYVWGRYGAEFFKSGIRGAIFDTDENGRKRPKTRIKWTISDI